MTQKTETPRGVESIAAQSENQKGTSNMWSIGFLVNGLFLLVGVAQ
jgi:hypothetical protein